MTPSRLAVVATILLATTYSAKTDFMNGNRLAAICQEAPSSQTYSNNKVFLFGYLQGLSDNALMVGVMSGTLSVCIPVGATAVQLVDIVCKYVRDNPSFRASGSAASVAEAALIEAYPCKAK